MPAIVCQRGTNDSKGSTCKLINPFMRQEEWEPQGGAIPGSWHTIQQLQGTVLTLAIFPASILLNSSLHSLNSWLSALLLSRAAEATLASSLASGLFFTGLTPGDAL